MARGVPVRLDQVSRRFGKVLALDRVSFELRPGEVVGLLGPNGAGKTTTMRVLTGYLRPDSGRVTVGDATATSAARRLIGYLPETAAPAAELTARGCVAYAAALWGLSRAERRGATATALRQTGLERVADQRVRTLSKGYRQRVALAQALVHDPAVLVLDEPTSGLDPAQVAETRNLIARLGRQRTVLLSSHLLSEVNALCRRVLIIDGGRVVADSDVASLVRAGAGRRIEVRTSGDPAVLAPLLEALEGVESVAVRPDRVIVRGSGDDLAERVSAAVVAAGHGLVELRAEEESLEDAYLRVVRR